MSRLVHGNGILMGQHELHFPWDQWENYVKESGAEIQWT